MQRMLKIEGMLASCNCGRQPKHWHDLAGDKHFLECAPCQMRTGKYPTFNEAVESWERHETGVIHHAHR